MSRPSKPCPARPDLHALAARAIAAFEALTPEQQAEHRAEQRRLWVIGELCLSNPDMTRERAAEIVDRVRREAA